MVALYQMELASTLACAIGAEQAEYELPLLSVFVRTECRIVSDGVRCHFDSLHRTEQAQC